MNKFYVLLAILALVLLSAKPKVETTNQIIEIGYSYALMDAGTAAMNQCWIYGDKSLQCKGATEVYRQLGWMLVDIRREIDIDEGRWP